MANPRFTFLGLDGRYQSCQWYTYEFTVPDAFRHNVHVPGQLARHLYNEVRRRHGQNVAFHVTMQYHLAGRDRWVHAGHARTALQRQPMTNVRVAGFNDLCRLLYDFLVEREELDEQYTSEAEVQQLDDGILEMSNYLPVDKVRFRVYIPTFVDLVGDRQSHLLTSVLRQNDCEPGTCLWNAIRQQNSRRPNLSKVTDEEFQRQTGIGTEGIRLDQLAQVEERFVYRNRVGNESRLALVVFDIRLNLLRLPPYTEHTDRNTKQFTSLVMFNRHFYSPKTPQLATELRLRAASA